MAGSIDGSKRAFHHRTGVKERWRQTTLVASAWKNIRLGGDRPVSGYCAWEVAMGPRLTHKAKCVSRCNMSLIPNPQLAYPDVSNALWRDLTIGCEGEPEDCSASYR